MAVSPGVQVVADADEPLFYADGYYWLYRDGIWLRSDSYRGGFARIDVNIVPGEIRDIQQPQIYAHYRRHAGQNYARGSQIRERQPARPQGTYQQPMQQQQQPMQQQPQPAQPGRTPTEPQPSSPSQQPPVPNPMPQNQGTPGAGTPSTQGSQIPENSPGAPLPSQRDRDTDRDRQNGGTAPSTTPTDRGADRTKSTTDTDKDRTKSTTDTDKDRTKSSTDVDKNRSDLDKNKSGMDKSGMNRDQNDAAKDNNKKARGNDPNKKDDSDKDVDKKTSPY